MTPVYEVKTRHTKKVLKAFIKFITKVNHPSATFRLCLLGGCFLLIGFAFHGASAMYVWLAVGVVVIAFAFLRKYISFAKLAYNDRNYQKGNDIFFTFGQSEFVITNMEDEEDMHGKYGEITSTYIDADYYYININNQDLHVIPMSDFVTGDVNRFGDFLMHKVGTPAIILNIPFKERLKGMWKAYKHANAEHDRVWEERRAAQKKEKEEKKKKK